MSRTGDPASLWSPPTPAAPTHLHGMPRTLCSSQGACSWDNPAAGRQRESVTSHMREDRCQQYLTTQMAGSPHPETGGYGSKETRKGLSFRTIRVMLRTLLQGLSPNRYFELSSASAQTFLYRLLEQVFPVFPHRAIPQRETQHAYPPSGPAPRRYSTSLQGPQSPPQSNGCGC